jgi:hypothetical protein
VHAGCIAEAATSSGAKKLLLNASHVIDGFCAVMDLDDMCTSIGCQLLGLLRDCVVIVLRSLELCESTKTGFGLRDKATPAFP